MLIKIYKNKYGGLTYVLNVYDNQNKQWASRIISHEMYQVLKDLVKVVDKTKE